MKRLNNSLTKFQIKIKANIPDIEKFENFRSGENLSLFILFWMGLISGFIIFNSIRYVYFNSNLLTVLEPLLYLIVLSIMLIISRTRFFRVNIYFLIIFLALYLNLQFYLPRSQISYFFLYVGLNVVIQMTASLFLTLKKSLYIPLIVNIGSTIHLLLLGYSDYGSLGLFQTLLFLDLVFFVLNYYYQKRYEQVHSYVDLLVKEKLVSEQALNTKNKFLAKMSHELRTPLNIASGALQTATIEEPTYSESQNVTKHFILEENHFNMIKKANYDLTNLINNLIIYSEMNENLLINSEFFDLSKVLKERFNYYKHYIDSNVNFSYQVQQFDDHILIKNDKTILQYVIDNLISNAIKNTHKGFIEVKINTIRMTDSKLKVSFEIQDSGIGISPAESERIFKGFSSDQNTDTLEKDQRGVKLGLNVTKNLLELIGGNISFESELQKGTTFFVSFESDYKIGEEKEEEKTDKCHQKILIAEDNLENQELLKFLLKRHNFSYEAFENGQQVLEKYTTNKNYLEYDIILMDLRMPIMDGFEATKKIRKFETENSLRKIPIIAVTAHALKEELLKSLDAGCNSYITKPYEFKDLEILINKYTKKELN